MTNFESPTPGISLLPQARKPDGELAVEYRDRMIEALKPVCALIAEAHTNKFRIPFAVNIDASGRGIIQTLEVIKVLA
jgi:hypothetical protein